jgi:hypothetical protein
MFRTELHKIPARVHCTVQVCRRDRRTCTPHHTVAGRSSISLTQSPFPFSATAAAHPLSATCRAVPLHPYALVGRSSVSLTQSPFSLPFTTAAAQPLLATCRAVPLHHLHACRLSCTHLRTLCDVHGLCTSGSEVGKLSNQSSCRLWFIVHVDKCQHIMLTVCLTLMFLLHCELQTEKWQKVYFS